MEYTMTSGKKIHQAFNTKHGQRRPCDIRWTVPNSRTSCNDLPCERDRLLVYKRVIGEVKCSGRGNTWTLEAMNFWKTLKHGKRKRKRKSRSYKRRTNKIHIHNTYMETTWSLPHNSITTAFTLER